MLPSTTRHSILLSPLLCSRMFLLVASTLLSTHHLSSWYSHRCTSTSSGILATHTRRFPTPGSLGASTKRPFFYGSFFGNLGAFWELAFASPFLFGASTSSRPCGGQNHKKSVENQLNDWSLLCQEITNNKNFNWIYQ